jgi:ribose 5-phosphate isomerase B
MKIAIASDHAGYKLKLKLLRYLIEKGYEIKDLGTDSDESVDYPEFGHAIAGAVEKKECDYGIAICGSGNGISMTTNKHQKIRCAICWNKEIAELARAHNNANICSLPGRFISLEESILIIETFFATSFEGGRHERRIKKIPLKNFF